MGKEASCCRVCLRKSKKSVQLNTVFSKNTIRLNYFCVFNICTRLGAFHDDMLPQYLCSNCGDDLITSFRFLQTAQETDRKLRQIEIGSKGGVDLKTIASQQNDTEAVYTVVKNSLKIESLACSKDPLEESEESVQDRNSPHDEISNWHNISLSPMDNEASNRKKSDDDDDDDNTPLKELFKIKAANKNNEQIKDIRINSDDVNKETRNSPTEDLVDFAISPEALIFPQGSYKCEKCPKAYFTAVGLKAHGIAHLPKSRKNKRKERVTTKKTLQIIGNEDKNQESLHGTEEPLNKELKMRKQKLPKAKKMFPCHVCDKHMISASKLRYHMVMHTGEKDYLCTMCPKAYSTIYALKHHMRTHTGERPYECKFCGDKFTRPTTLKSHMRRHTGERPYGCDVCGKRFIQHSSMTTHMKLNHMAKTIPCPHCEKKYARQTDLNTHLLSHTGNKPFSCHICSSRFIRQANLNKHMNQHHDRQQSRITESITVPSKVDAQYHATKETKKLTAGRETETEISINDPVAIGNTFSSNIETSKIGIQATQTFTSSSNEIIPSSKADDTINVESRLSSEEQPRLHLRTTALNKEQQHCENAIGLQNTWSWTANTS